MGLVDWILAWHIFVSGSVGKEGNSGGGAPITGSSVAADRSKSSYSWSPLEFLLFPRSCLWTPKVLLQVFWLQGVVGQFNFLPQMISVPRSESVNSTSQWEILYFLSRSADEQWGLLNFPLRWSHLLMNPLQNHSRLWAEVPVCLICFQVASSLWCPSELLISKTYYQQPVRTAMRKGAHAFIYTYLVAFISNGIYIYSYIHRFIYILLSI